MPHAYAAVQNPSSHATVASTPFDLIFLSLLTYFVSIFVLFFFSLKSVAKWEWNSSYVCDVSVTRTRMNYFAHKSYVWRDEEDFVVRLTKSVRLNDVKSACEMINALVSKWSSCRDTKISGVWTTNRLFHFSMTMPATKELRNDHVIRRNAQANSTRLRFSASSAP